MVVEEIPPFHVKRFEYPEKRYINVMNYRIGDLCRHIGNVFLRHLILYVHPYVNKKEKVFQ